LIRAYAAGPPAFGWNDTVPRGTTLPSSVTSPDTLESKVPPQPTKIAVMPKHAIMTLYRVQRDIIAIALPKSQFAAPVRDSADTDHHMCPHHHPVSLASARIPPCRRLRSQLQVDFVVTGLDRSL
jgi:hypothetical protein